MEYMTIEIIKELKPLVANLRKLDIANYLISTEFDNIMLENDFDSEWLQMIKEFNGVGYTRIRSVINENAFFTICNLSWQKERDYFFRYIKASISAFINSTNNKYNFTQVINCLNDLGMDKNGIEELQAFNNNKQARINSGSVIISKKIGKVFIGHGGSLLWREVESFLKEENVPCETFESDSRTGEHVIDILGGCLDRATFAIIIVTAEDQTVEGKIRARQNVIHEIGLFQGRLGFNKVAILKQDEAESFSNNDGLQHIPFSGSKIDQTFHKLRKALIKASLIKK